MCAPCSSAAARAFTTRTRTSLPLRSTATLQLACAARVHAYPDDVRWCPNLTALAWQVLAKQGHTELLAELEVLALERNGTPEHVSMWRARL